MSRGTRTDYENISLSIRFPKGGELYKEIQEMAEQAGISLNAVIMVILREKVSADKYRMEMRDRAGLDK